MLIDNTGITLKLGEAQRRHADSVGKSVNELTAQSWKHRHPSVTGRRRRSCNQVGGSLDSMTSDTRAQISPARA